MQLWMRLPVVPCVLVLMALPASLLASDEALDAAAIEVHDGFAVERVYSVPREFGSWVAMCFDDRGRIYASDQGQRLFRITPPAVGSPGECRVEVVSDQWGYSQGMTFLQGALYVVQHGDHSEENFRPDVLLRLTDSDGDDRLDAVERLIEFPRVTGDAANWTEHSLHAVVPGPDGKSLYIVSGDRNGLPCEQGRARRIWNRDGWDFEFSREPHSGGWVMRADLDGKNPEFLCMGLRNCYDLAFNRRGDLFTYDSDLENDFGLPTYRPTAIRQVLSGTDGGWGGRAGEMLWSWPAHWEDIQPPLANIGPGSPTGICFGYGTQFPARYQNALFACDWSYGRMFAVHLAPVGASYAAEPEPFLSAQGLPIADVAVSPREGVLYFLIGGRGTQSGLYRVSYTGPESTAPAADDEPSPETAAAQELRRRLETLHGPKSPAALDVIWPNLGHSDRAIRSAARTALEWQPVRDWRERAIAEQDPRTALQALLALARSTDGDPAVQQELLAALERFEFGRLSAEEQCWYLRILTISAVRHGRYRGEVAARIVARLEPAIPSSDRRVNQELVSLSAALQSRSFIEPTLDLLEQSRTQEEQVLYSQALTRSSQTAAWTPALRERFLRLAVERIPHWRGGPTCRAVKDRIQHELIQMLPLDERSRLADVMSLFQKPVPIVPPTKRELVRQWKLDDLVPHLEAGLAEPRNLENGRRLFSESACLVCHSFQGEGGLGGPDLTSAGRRYNPRDLLDNIVNPSRVINEQYALQIYVKTDGTTVTGRTVNRAGDLIMVALNPNDPVGSEVRFSIRDLESTTRSPTSFMPAGLLDTLTRDDILDLLAYLRSQ
jgi:putative heme-binding domain-containing protein